MYIGMKNLMGCTAMSYSPRIELLGLLNELVELGYISTFVFVEHDEPTYHSHTFIIRNEMNISEGNLFKLLEFHFHLGHSSWNDFVDLFM